ncbi:MAG: glycogen synthase [Peptoniphilus sp.]|nr:glycogen synthase [Peptoniphilus sp.]MDY3118960.1 glycogen synthase [Peptoniphilus sp.]
MNIVYCASEVHPYLKTGGLADVMGALPRAVKRSQDRISVIMPLYGQIPRLFREAMEFLGYDYVQMGGCSMYMGVFHLRERGVDYYFIDNRDMFFRDTVYGEADDGYRFTFFSKACVRLMAYLDQTPDVVHANDWHTGLVPLYVKDFARGDARFSKTATVFTIHNINYQGVFEENVFSYADLSREYFTEEGVKYYDGVNLMKAGIQYADAVTTVSKTYAEELEDEAYGRELAGLIRRHRGKMTGILNGIDTEEYDPKGDPLIEKNYDKDHVQDKEENKRALKKEYGLEASDRPLFTVVSRLVDIKGMDLVLESAEALLKRELDLLVVGTGDRRIEEGFRALARSYDNCAVRIAFDAEGSHRVYAGGDFFLMPSLTEPCGLAQMIAMTYGNLPIVRKTGGLADTVCPFDERGVGGGYTFLPPAPKDLLAAVDRALADYKTPSDVVHRKSAMTYDFSWTIPAEDYRKLYKKVRGIR